MGPSPRPVGLPGEVPPGGRKATLWSPQEFHKKTFVKSRFPVGSFDSMTRRPRLRGDRSLLRPASALWYGCQRSPRYRGGAACPAAVGRLNNVCPAACRQNTSAAHVQGRFLTPGQNSPIGQNSQPRCEIDTEFQQFTLERTLPFDQTFALQSTTLSPPSIYFKQIAERVGPQAPGNFGGAETLCVRLACRPPAVTLDFIRLNTEKSAHQHREVAGRTRSRAREVDAYWRSKSIITY